MERIDDWSGLFDEPDPLAVRAAEVLRERGILTVDELVEALGAEWLPAGPAGAATLLDALDDAPAVHLLGGERLVEETWALTPLVVTQRVGEDELARGYLRGDVDLEPLLHLRPDEDALEPFVTSTGGEIDTIYRPIDDDSSTDGLAEGLLPDGALVGPVGWLEGARPGGLVALEWDGQHLEVHPVDDPDHTRADEVAAWLGSAFDSIVAEPGSTVPRAARDDLDRAVEIATLVVEVAAEHRDAFTRPTLPLAELVERAGLEWRGSYVASADFDWEAWTERRVARASAVLDRMQAPGLVGALDDDARGLWEAVYAAFHAYLDLLDDLEQPDPDPAASDLLAQLPLEALARSLDVDGVATALVATTVGEDHELAEGLSSFAERILDELETGGAHFVAARAAEYRRDHVAVAEHVAAALRHGPETVEVLEDAAWLASDRGDAGRAAALLFPIQQDDDPDLALYQRFAAPGPNAAGRNDPCPCGSGRKYKACCASTNGHSLDDRLPWLWHKAQAFAQRPPNRMANLLVAAALVGGDVDDPDEAIVTTLFRDPLVPQLVLGTTGQLGSLTEFVDQRGPFLPADEAELARAWAARRPSLYEVVDVEPGTSLTLRDVMTGEVSEVSERLGSRDRTAGELLFTLLLPDSTGALQIWGGYRVVPLGSRDSLVELLADDPDALTIARWFAAASRVTLQNTEGEPLRFCLARWPVDDPQALAAALDAHPDLESDDGEDLEDGIVSGRQTWRELVVTQGMPRVRATLALADGVLEVETNSEPRHEGMLALVGELLPGVTPDERRESPDQARSRLAREESLDDGPRRSLLADPTPEEREALVEFIAEYEANWCDQPVPLLGGLTPRQALDDPTRRGDLEKLLDQIGEPADVGHAVGMSATRLRKLLGLT